MGDPGHGRWPTATQYQAAVQNLRHSMRAASPTAEPRDPLETSLARCLSRRAEELGLAHTIELVRLGDRYDPTRRNSPTRGMSVVGVHGWVVLRGPQRVYTKASVALE